MVLYWFGIVLSKDGSKIYKIDVYWYGSSAVWISDNKLLAEDQKGSKIFTFNPDGTFQTHKINPIMEDGYFVQNDYYSGHGATKKELSIRMAINENVVSVLDALCLLEELEAL